MEGKGRGRGREGGKGKGREGKNTCLRNLKQFNSHDGWDMSMLLVCSPVQQQYAHRCCWWSTLQIVIRVSRCSVLAARLF